MHHGARSKGLAKLRQRASRIENEARAEPKRQGFCETARKGPRHFKQGVTDR